MCHSVYIYLYISIYLSVCYSISIYLSIYNRDIMGSFSTNIINSYLYIYMSILNLSICLGVFHCLSILMPFISIYLSTCVSFYIYLPIYRLFYIYLSMCHSISIYLALYRDIGLGSVNKKRSNNSITYNENL